MKKILMAAAPLALLAACSGCSSDQLEAGEWTMTAEMTEFEASGVSEERIEEIRVRMEEQTGTKTLCITDEEAANPVSKLFVPENVGGDCDFTNSTFEDGVISVSLSCEDPNVPASTTMAMEGSYAPTTMAVEIALEFEAPPVAMSMASTITGERTGDCEAESSD